jgi:hypothetical protein
MTDDRRSLWAWVTQLADGRLSILRAMVDDTHFPFIAHEREHVERLRPIARAHYVKTGQRVWLREFTGVIDHGDA